MLHKRKLSLVSKNANNNINSSDGNNYRLFYFCIIVFLIALKKITNNTFIKYIIAIWTISSLFSIIYYNASKEYTRITIMPYIFFIVSMLCILYPMVAYNDKRMIITLNNAYAFKCVVVFLCIISILPFIENIIHVISTYSISSSSALADIYDDKMSGDLNKTKILVFILFQERYATH